MPKQSAGILLYRFSSNTLELFLVHPGGPFYSKKDLGSWSIPKGEFEKDEESFEAAKREFKEETGFSFSDEKKLELTPIKQKSGKRVYAWAVEGDIDPLQIKSNFFTLEWPPKSGKNQEFPEIDRAEWFSVQVAKEKNTAESDWIYR